MKEAKTFTRVERKRVTILTNNNQAKKLALLNIYKTGYEYENT
jgi:hypothetical protein